jgi:hypothetical protein
MKTRSKLTIAGRRKPTLAPPRFGPDHAARSVLANRWREQIMRKLLELARLFLVGVVHDLVHFGLKELQRLDRVLGSTEFPEVLAADVESTSSDYIGYRWSERRKKTGEQE